VTCALRVKSGRDRRAGRAFQARTHLKEEVPVEAKEVVALMTEMLPIPGLHLDLVTGDALPAEDKSAMMRPLVRL
jgi:hypothetical protein